MIQLNPQYEAIFNVRRSDLPLALAGFGFVAYSSLQVLRIGY